MHLLCLILEGQVDPLATPSTHHPVQVVTEDTVQDRIQRKVGLATVSSVANLVIGHVTAHQKKGMLLGPAWVVAVEVAIVSSVVSPATGLEIALQQAALRKGLQEDTAVEGVDMVAVDATRNTQYLLYPVCVPSLLGVTRLARSHPIQLSSTKTP